MKILLALIGLIALSGCSTMQGNKNLRYEAAARGCLDFVRAARSGLLLPKQAMGLCQRAFQARGLDEAIFRQPKIMPNIAPKEPKPKAQESK